MPTISLPELIIWHKIFSWLFCHLRCKNLLMYMMKLLQDVGASCGQLHPTVSPYPINEGPLHHSILKYFQMLLKWPTYSTAKCSGYDFLQKPVWRELNNTSVTSKNRHLRKQLLLDTQVSFSFMQHKSLHKMNNAGFYHRNYDIIFPIKWRSSIFLQGSIGIIMLSYLCHCIKSKDSEAL